MSDSSSSTHAVPLMASSSSGVGGRSSSSLLLSSTSSSMPSSSTMMMMSSAATSSLPSSTTTSSLLLRSSSSASSTTSTTGGIGSGSSENLPPRTLARVARDVRDLLSKTPHLEGIRLVVDAETGMPGSLSEIMAEIEGPEQTPYHTKYFALKLILSADFPNSPPRAYFMTKIYHPNVDPSTGAICVNTLKTDWTTSTTIGHVLSVIRCLLIVPFPESSLNDEAGKNFMSNYDEYYSRAKLLASVHGLSNWSSTTSTTSSNSSGSNNSEDDEKKPSATTTTKSTSTSGGGDGENDNNDNNNNVDDGNDDDDDDCKKPSSLSTSNSNSSANPLGKTGSRSNIVRSGSKMLDKKNKKKSLRRL